MSSITHSLSHASQRVRAAVRRFSISIALLVATACWAAPFLAAGTSPATVADRFLGIWLPIAALLSIALQLWTEDFAHPKRRIAAWLAAHGLWLAGAALITLTDVASADLGVMLAAIGCLVCVGGVVLPFRYAPTDIPLWHFTRRLLAGFLLACATSLLLMLGLFLLLWMLKALFHIRITDHAFVWTATLVWIAAAPTIWLQSVPTGREKHDAGTAQLPPLVSSILHYVFLPLLGVYFVVLYAYALYILFTFRLPEGMVSWPVGILTAATFAYLMIVSPTRSDTTRGAAHRLQRCMPALLLPLLVLMSVAIARRLTDYGLTTPRLYVLAFNLWAYAACGFLLLRPTLKISWLPVSFVLLLFVSSVGPQRFAAWMLRHHQARLASLMDATQAPSRPMTVTDYETWVATLDSAQQSQALDATALLAENYAPAVGLRGLIRTDSTSYGFWRGLAASDYGQPGHFSAYGLLQQPTQQDIAGFTRMERIDGTFRIVGTRQQHLLIDLATSTATHHTATPEDSAAQPARASRDRLLTLSTARLRQLDARPAALTAEGRDLRLLVDHFVWTERADSIELSGLLLSR